jgi:copper resistance protein C
MRHRLSALVLIVTMALPGSGAWAHAVLTSSAPAVGSIVLAGTIRFALHYNSRVDHVRSALTITNPDQSRNRLTVAGGGPDDELDAETSLLKPGTYNLRWQVLAVDGHITRGDIPFSVKAP